VFKVLVLCLLRMHAGVYMPNGVSVTAAITVQVVLSQQQTTATKAAKQCIHLWLIHGSILLVVHVELECTATTAAIPTYCCC
jgi:hypothetical protein